MSAREQKVMRAKDRRHLVADRRLSKLLLLIDDGSMLNCRHIVADRLLSFILLLNGGRGGNAIEAGIPV